jgi:hypothetical protein
MLVGKGFQNARIILTGAQRYSEGGVCLTSPVV